MEKFSSIKRVVGDVSDAEKENILQEMDGRFSDQELEMFKGRERTKTLEESQIISLANEITNKVRERYGLEDFNIPPDNIHVIKKEEWPKKNSSLFDMRGQYIAVCERPANIVFMKTILHEMLHFKSYNARQITQGENTELDDYRMGLTVSTRETTEGARKPGKNIYFVNLNEAVTEEMTKRLMRDHAVQNPLFAQEVKRLLEIRKKYSKRVMDNGELLYDNDTYYLDIQDKEGSNDMRYSHPEELDQTPEIVRANFGYPRERNILRNLIDKITERNSGEFKDREEVFEVFAKAMMTGNLLPVGRLIDGTFGKGTLRRIGQLDGDIEAQEAFIKSL